MVPLIQPPHLQTRGRAQMGKVTRQVNDNVSGAKLGLKGSCPVPSQGSFWNEASKVTTNIWA